MPRTCAGLRSVARAPRNIALTGFMGTGKSVVARALGRLTGYGVVDVDARVEQAAGLSVPEIFASEGEQAFREREAEAVREIAKEQGQIISTGGGVVLRSDNMEALRSGGAVIVNLRASAESVFERTKNSSHRPLLETEDPLGRIRRLMAEREEHYRQADLIVDTGGKSPVEVAEEIMEGLKSWTR